jgi:uncharacterized damage-inducible protein DinB
MTNREFFKERRMAELPAFLRVLKAVPQGRLDYRPDPKARTAAEIAWLLTEEEGSLATLLEKGAVEWKDTPPPARFEEIVATFERHSARVTEKLGQIDEARWEGKGRFFTAGAAPWEDTTANLCWSILFDAIHHRGQLSTYLRPMGGKIPQIYGPTADDPGK